MALSRCPFVSSALVNSKTEAMKYLGCVEQQTNPVYNEFLFLNGMTKQVQVHHADKTTPILVHCGTGVSRTAVYIATDALIEQYEKEGEVNVFSFVQSMRKDRSMMVRCVDQYVFIYKTLQEDFEAGNTNIDLDTGIENVRSDLQEINPNTGHTYLEDQFELLNFFSIDFIDCDVNGARKSDKKCIQNLELSAKKGLTNDICPVFIDGYRIQGMFALLTTPCDDVDIIDFWRFICHHDVISIVQMGRESDGCGYVTSHKQGTQTAKGRKEEDERLVDDDVTYQIEIVSVYQYDDIIIRDIRLKEFSDKVNRVREIRHFSLPYHQLTGTEYRGTERTGRKEKSQRENKKTESYRKKQLNEDFISSSSDSDDTDDSSTENSDDLASVTQCECGDSNKLTMESKSGVYQIDKNRRKDHLAMDRENGMNRKDRIDAQNRNSPKVSRHQKKQNNYGRDAWYRFQSEQGRHQVPNSEKNYDDLGQNQRQRKAMKENRNQKKSMPWRYIDYFTRNKRKTQRYKTRKAEREKNRIEYSLSTSPDGDFQILQDGAILPVDGYRPEYPVDRSRPEYPVDRSRPEYPVDRSRPEYPIDRSRPEYPIDRSRPEYAIDRRRPEYPIDRSRPEYPIGRGRPEYPIDRSRPDNPIDGRRPEFIGTEYSHRNPDRKYSHQGYYKDSKPQTPKSPHWSIIGDHRKFSGRPTRDRHTSHKQTFYLNQQPDIDLGLHTRSSSFRRSAENTAFIREQRRYSNPRGHRKSPMLYSHPRAADYSNEPEVTLTSPGQTGVTLSSESGDVLPASSYNHKPCELGSNIKPLTRPSRLGRDKSNSATFPNYSTIRSTSDSSLVKNVSTWTSSLRLRPMVTPSYFTFLSSPRKVKQCKSLSQVPNKESLRNPASPCQQIGVSILEPSSHSSISISLNENEKIDMNLIRKSSHIEKCLLKYSPSLLACYERRVNVSESVVCSCTDENGSCLQTTQANQDLVMMNENFLNQSNSATSPPRLPSFPSRCKLQLPRSETVQVSGKKNKFFRTNFGCRPLQTFPFGKTTRFGSVFSSMEYLKTTDNFSDARKFKNGRSSSKFKHIGTSKDKKKQKAPRRKTRSKVMKKIEDRNKDVTHKSIASQVFCKCHRNWDKNQSKSGHLNKGKTFEKKSRSQRCQLPVSPGLLLELLELVLDWQATPMRERIKLQKTSKFPPKTSPLLIHSPPGNEAASLLCACALVCECMQEDQQVDVYHVIKHMRRMKPRAIESFAQYELIHKCLSLYVTHYMDEVNFTDRWIYRGVKDKSFKPVMHQILDEQPCRKSTSEGQPDRSDPQTDVISYPADVTDNMSPENNVTLRRRSHPYTIDRMSVAETQELSIKRIALRRKVKDTLSPPPANVIEMATTSRVKHLTQVHECVNENLPQVVQHFSPHHTFLMSLDESKNSEAQNERESHLPSNGGQTFFAGMRKRSWETKTSPNGTEWNEKSDGDSKTCKKEDLKTEQSKEEKKVVKELYSHPNSVSVCTRDDGTNNGCGEVSNNNDDDETVFDVEVDSDEMYRTDDTGQILTQQMDH